MTFSITTADDFNNFTRSLNSSLSYHLVYKSTTITRRDIEEMVAPIISSGESHPSLI